MKKTYPTDTVKVRPKVRKLLHAEKERSKMPIADIVEAAVESYVKGKR